MSEYFSRLGGVDKVDMQYEGDAVYNHVYDSGYFDGFLAGCAQVAAYPGLGATPVAPGEENLLIEAWLHGPSAAALADPTEVSADARG
jgi:hypothetical protein